MGFDNFPSNVNSWLPSHVTWAPTPSASFAGSTVLSLHSMRTVRILARAAHSAVRRAQAADASSRVAVLVDADNVPSRLARVILDEIEEHVGGTQVDRRVYGDFSLSNNQAWKVCSLELGFACIFQASAKGSKNATDIALSIDAMDILHAGDLSVDTFVIVTNDGDFAPVCSRPLPARWCARTARSPLTNPCLCHFGTARSAPAPFWQACCRCWHGCGADGLERFASAHKFCARAGRTAAPARRRAEVD